MKKRQTIVLRGKATDRKPRVLCGEAARRAEREIRRRLGGTARAKREREREQ